MTNECGSADIFIGTDERSREKLVQLFGSADIYIRTNEFSFTIDRSLKYDNVFTKPFKVNHCVDLNWNLANKLPIIRNDTTEICCLSCCLCSGSGEIVAKLKIPFGGIIKGQRIPFQLFVHNDSNVNINNSKVKFKKIMTFESTTPVPVCKKIVIDLDIQYFDSVLRLSDKEFKNYIELPTDLPCTQLGRCIRIEYFINGQLYTDCCRNKINLEIPITIGSIPFTEETFNTNNETIITRQPTAPPPSIVSESNILPTVYNALDLPSYEYAIQMLAYSEDESCNAKSTNAEEYGFRSSTLTDDYNGNGISNNAAASSSGATKMYGWPLS